MNEIKMIPIGDLEHHPDNPRADLGDVSELAASIKAKGIMQNLTVIPDLERQKYLVVIGNRRLEAAKLAGLIELPCRIADMSKTEVLQTMIAENMQRSDLTVMDQINGIGKMQQLGMTLPEIAKGTGLSETTIRRRATIGTLPKKQLEKDEKRIAELDRLFIRLYEDNVASRISDDRFVMMSRAYEDEQHELKAEAEVLRQEIETQEQQNRNLELFIQKVRKYADMTELTPYAAHELIKAIYVGAPDKSSGKRRQSIHICYDLIGFIPLSELMEQEMA